MAEPLPCSEKDQECIQMAMSNKEIGNALFREGHIRKAMRKYHDALLYLKGFEDNPLTAFGSSTAYPTSISKLNTETRKVVQDLNISLSNNLAACTLKVEKWESVLRHTEQVLKLDPENAKALFRRGSAMVQLNNFEEGLKMLQQAATLNPKDVAIKKQLQVANVKLKDYREKEKKLFKGAFSE